MPDALNSFIGTNNLGHVPSYSEFNTLFVYHITLVEIHLSLVFCILEGYATDNWWAQVRLQILNNKKLGTNKALFLFVIEEIQSSDAKFYFKLRPDGPKATGINIL